jgi:protein-tyrosine-phosphatase
MSESEPHRIFNVLFVCTGNACRSIMAEAIMNRVGRGRFRAYSAGTTPAGEINPHALALLRQMHHDCADLRCKSWEEFSHDYHADAPELDFVFTVCDDAAGEVCPVWPGEPLSAHWGVPDPVLAGGTEAEIAVAFGEAYRMLNNRIGLFMNLPMTALDRMVLQQHLEDIGKAHAPAAD